MVDYATDKPKSVTPERGSQPRQRCPHEFSFDCVQVPVTRSAPTPARGPVLWPIGGGGRLPRLRSALVQIPGRPPSLSAPRPGPSKSRRPAPPGRPRLGLWFLRSLDGQSARVECQPETASIDCCWTHRRPRVTRSEEHTSELQSLRHLVCRLLLE